MPASSTTAGQDYTAASGTLTFNPGEIAKTVSVPVLNNAIDDGGETMTLTLSNADNARIADATATGTIENTDPLQQAWIARFGRIVAGDVVDGITERLSTARSGSEVRIAGVTLQHNGSTWTETPGEATELGDALKGERTLNGRDVSARELLLQSAFHLQGVSDSVDLWAIGGYGAGDMTIDEDGCQRTRTDIDMTMAAVGVHGQVLDARAGDALDLAVRSDVLWLRTASDKTEGLEAAEADVMRLRLMVDAGRVFSTAGGGTLTPSIEAGVRHDAGDAEEGIGFEVGGGLAYQGTGITIEGKVRTLVAHDDSAYEEWGASASVRIDPGGDGRGLSLAITPTWGSAASEAEQLWSARNAGQLGDAGDFKAEQRLDAKLGYGLGAPHGWGVVTPWAGLSLADGAERTLRTGLRWKAADSATVALEAAREDNAAQGRPDHAVMLRANVRF